MENKDNTLAMEILHEMKTENKRKDQTTKILIAVIVILIVSLVVSNVAWLVYESQWEEVEATTVNGDSATYLENSESGDINYGNYTQSN